MIGCVCDVSALALLEKSDFAFVNSGLTKSFATLYENVTGFRTQLESMR